MRRLRSSLLPRLLLLVVAIVVAVVLAEIGLRLTAAVAPSVDAMLGSGSSPTIPDPVLGHRPSPQMSDSDRSGFRNARRPRSVAVVALGDSQTFGMGVAREDAWPSLLASEHGIPTYNMAYGGYGPTHELVLAREALDELSPKVLVVAMYGGNDLFDCWRMVWARGQLAELLPSNPDERKELQRAAATLPPPETEWNRLWETTAAPAPAGNTLRTVLATHLRLYGLARALKRTMTRTFAIRAGAEHDAADPEEVHATVAVSDPHTLLVVRAGAVTTVLTPAARLAAVDLTDPRIREGLRLSREAISRIQGEAEARGARVLVLMIATKELVFAPWVDAGSPAQPTLERLVQQETRIWEEVGATCHELGVECVSTVSPFRDGIAAGRNPYFEDWDGHPSRVGHRIIADAVAATTTMRSLAPAENPPRPPR